MTDVLFYHLQSQSLETVLPGLLEKSLERGWRAVVQSGHEARIEALNAHLWSFNDESFLAHGSRVDGNAEKQPIWLTTGDENPNEAKIRFLMDGAVIDDHMSYDRIVYLFDGNDPEALDHARKQWKRESQQGHDVTYWSQNERGRWEKIA